jgi:hypothetical protein
LAAKAFTACTSLVTNETQTLANSEIVHSCLCNDTNLEPELRCYVTHFYECIYSIQDLLIKPPFNLTYPPSPFAGLIQHSTDFFCGNNTLYYDLFGWSGDLFDLSFEWGFPLDLPLATLSNTTGGLFPGADLPWPVGGAHGIVLEPSVESVNEKRDVRDAGNGPACAGVSPFHFSLHTLKISLKMLIIPQSHQPVPSHTTSGLNASISKLATPTTTPS